MRMGGAGKLLVVGLTVVLVGSAGAQFVGQGAKKVEVKPSVEYLFPEQVAMPAGKATNVALHFRVAPGLHINSHTPRAAELIPTTLSIPEESGVKLVSASYPQGVNFAFELDPKHPLSVYTGEFVVTARMVAQPGSHLVEAKLRYQACDDNACMPPKIIVVAMEVVGR